MRINFELSKWLKDKSQKVETRDGRPVKIISFEMTDTNGCPIAAQFRLVAGTPVVFLFDKEGRYRGEGDSDYDLFIITSEPELSEFEKRIRFIIDEVVDGRYNADNIEDVKGIAKGLLELARDQFIKDGYVLEKQSFHDAVENISDKHLAEMSVEYSLHCKIEDGTRHAIMNWEAFQKVAQKFIDVGKADALKDLPRWIDNWDTLRPYKDISGLQYIVLNGKAMNVSDLSKLPGFKED